jgi:ketosteroid isomerase-like protein
MSANADLVVRALRLFEGENWEDAEPLWREDAWISGPPDWPESEPFRGRTAVIGQFRRLAADWNGHHFADLEVVHDDGDWVVLGFTWTVRGAASGAVVEAPMSGAYRIEDGSFAEAHFRRTVEEALEVVNGR